MLRREAHASHSSKHLQSGSSKKAVSDESIKSRFRNKTSGKSRSSISLEREICEASSDESVGLTPKRARKLYKFSAEVLDCRLLAP